MLPRLGLASPASGPEPSLASLALLAGLTAAGRRVQHFRSRACPLAAEVVGQATGLPGRHLDAWLMTERFCRGIFARAAASCDLAIVEGSLESPTVTTSLHCDRPGDLEPIADFLDLPLVAIVSCRGRKAESFHLPRLPEGVEAILLDEVEGDEQAVALKRLVRLATGVPVIGAVESLPDAREALQDLRHEQLFPEGWLDRLAKSFLKHADLAAIEALAASRPPLELPAPPALAAGCGRQGRIRVAFARDEIFGRYFPDTLDALEELGAQLVEFSPLRDESLPGDVDLVLIGCGCPDQEIAALSSNLSMIGALRVHVCRGRRIYAEGGGAAYLARTVGVRGRTYPCAGILPFHAELEDLPEPPVPVVRSLLHDCWLGDKGTTVRGYRSGRWRISPSTSGLDCPACHGTLSAEGDWFFHHHAVGSLMHLYLPALPDVASAFAGPHSPSLRRPLPSRIRGADATPRPHDD